MTENQQHNEQLADDLKRTPDAGAFVAALLDKIDRLGNVPNVFSLPAAAFNKPEDIRWFFGPKFVAVGPTKVTLKLKELLQQQPGIVDTLYAVTRRIRRNLRGERTDLASRLSAVIDEFAGVACTVFRDWLAAESQNAAAGRGELFSLARTEGFPVVKNYLTALSRGLSFLASDSRPVRLSRFGLEVAGDTKCCRPGTQLLNSFARIIYRFDASVKAEVDLSEPANESEKLRMALEQTRLQLDGSASRILVFGNLVFEKGGERFDYVRRHAALGEPVVLTWAQLYNSSVVAVPAKVLCIENETTFFEYAERADPAIELILCTMGQANRLLVSFLSQLQRMAAEIWHWGDLDRSGVLILDSLRRRTGLEIRPMRMDVKTFRDHAARGRALPAAEKQLIVSLLQRRPDIICADLLNEIASQNLWLEQENIGV